MNCGDAIDASRHVFTIMENSQRHTATQLVSSCPASDFSSAYSNCLSTDPDTSMIHTKLKLVENPPRDPLTITAHVLSMFHSTMQTSFTTYSTSNYVLDPGFPAMEHAPAQYNNDLFGRQFGIPVHNNEAFTARQLSNIKLLRCYSIPAVFLILHFNFICITDLLDDMLPFSVPLGINSTVLSEITEAAGFLDDIVYGNSVHADNHQCYHIAASPMSLDWTHTYKEDPSTGIMLRAFTKTKKSVWSVDTLNKMELEYVLSLIVATIGLLHDKFVLYKPVFYNKHISPWLLFPVPYAGKYLVIFTQILAAATWKNIRPYSESACVSTDQVFARI